MAEEARPPLGQQLRRRMRDAVVDAITDGVADEVKERGRRFLSDRRRRRDGDR